MNMPCSQNADNLNSCELQLNAYFQSTYLGVPEIL